LSAETPDFDRVRRCGRHDGDARATPSGEGDEAAEDDPVAELILRAPDHEQVAAWHRFAE
jgi:hypothetical protein